MEIKTYKLNHYPEIFRCGEKDLSDILQPYPYECVLILTPIQNAVVWVLIVLIVDRDIALICEEV